MQSVMPCQHRSSRLPLLFTTISWLHSCAEQKARQLKDIVQPIEISGVIIVLSAASADSVKIFD